MIVALITSANRNTEELAHQEQMDAGYIFTNVEIAKQKFGI
jgi:hypothetical protein